MENFNNILCIFNFFYVLLYYTDIVGYNDQLFDKVFLLILQQDNTYNKLFGRMCVTYIKLVFAFFFMRFSTPSDFFYSMSFSHFFFLSTTKSYDIITTIFFFIQ